MITHAPVVVSRANKKLSGRQSNFRVGDDPTGICKSRSIRLDERIGLFSSVDVRTFMAELVAVSR
jgi:hypothetical protein